MSSPDIESIATMVAESHSVSVEAERATSASCPKCRADLALHRTFKPHIDSGGFENYFLKCDQCSVWLIGIIDPHDETLLLTEIEG
jgi:hypothetical protein